MVRGGSWRFSPELGSAAIDTELIARKLWRHDPLAGRGAVHARGRILVGRSNVVRRVDHMRRVDFETVNEHVGVERGDAGVVSRRGVEQETLQAVCRTALCRKTGLRNA